MEFIGIFKQLLFFRTDALNEDLCKYLESSVCNRQ